MSVLLSLNRFGCVDRPYRPNEHDNSPNYIDHDDCRLTYSNDHENNVFMFTWFMFVDWQDREKWKSGFRRQPTCIW